MKILQHKTIRVLITTIVILLLLTLISVADVSATGLKITPLKYEEQLELGSHKTGYVDVSNPTDLNITVTTDVQAFRQVTSRGDLEFYDDEQISAGIVTDVDEFALGPREAARIFFTIDSNKLLQGGVYAALFFATEAQSHNPEASSLATTARVGTLLILENGNEGVKDGRVTDLNLSFWQFGRGINGSVSFEAFNDSRYSLAVTPELTMRIPLASTKPIEGGLVFAGNTREFALEQTGNYIGVFPVEVRDNVTGSSQSVWVLAITGIWRVILPLFIILVVTSLALQFYFKRH